MLSSRDNFLYHEMLSHPVLYTHPAPRRVAIIGGGDCGTLREVLRHPEIEQVTQIEIDERVTRLAEIYFPELCESNTDPRAELLFRDGVEWMEQAETGSLEVIIVDSTDPIGPGAPLFSAPFYRACQRVLADGGLLAQQSESPLIHMDTLQRMYQAMEAAGFHDRKSLFFPQCVYPSGWWSATLARKGAIIKGFREADVQGRPFTTRYYNTDIHRAAFAAPEFFNRQLDCDLSDYG
jgi:spermidine synthase